MSFPLAHQSFIPESFDYFQTVGPGNKNNIFPTFLIPFQNLFGQSSKLFLYGFVFEYLPHTIFSIYILFSMSRSPQNKESNLFNEVAKSKEYEMECPNVQKFHILAQVAQSTMPIHICSSSNNGHLHQHLTFPGHLALVLRCWRD